MRWRQRLKHLRAAFTWATQDRFYSPLRYVSDTGLEINPATALQATSVYDAVWVIASTVAALPLKLYQKDLKGNVREVEDHPLAYVLHDAANPETTAFDFRLSMMVNLCLTGNAYAEIIRDGKGRVKELWQWDYANVVVERDGWNLKYKLSAKSGQIERSSRDMFHLHAMSFDGLTGLSVTALHKNAIALAMAAEKYGAVFFKQGCTPPFILKHPSTLSEEAAKNLAESFQEAWGGLDNAGSVPILEEDMDVIKVGIAPEDSQTLETRKYQTTEIARSFSVPPHKIKDLERSTFSNIEHQGIEFIIYSIMPHLKNWEQRISLKLLTPEERAQQLYAEFNVSGLLRGDTETRHRAYQRGIQHGYYSPNDVRRMENLNPRPGGDIYLTPSNLTPDPYLVKQGQDKQGRQDVQSLGNLPGNPDREGLGNPDREGLDNPPSNPDRLMAELFLDQSLTGDIEGVTDN